MDVTIHSPAGPAQWTAAAAILRRYVAGMRTEAGFEPFAVQPSFEAELDDLEAHYASIDRCLLVATVGSDDIVGTVALQHHGPATELKRMFVDPAWRGRGIADDLVSAAVRAATTRGSAWLWLETVRGPMDAAIAVYVRHGFRPTDRRPPTLAIDGLVVMERAVYPATVDSASSTMPATAAG